MLRRRRFGFFWRPYISPVKHWTFDKRGKDIFEKLESAKNKGKPGLFRMALKLATEACKTTVMAC